MFPLNLPDDLVNTSLYVATQFNNHSKRHTKDSPKSLNVKPNTTKSIREELTIAPTSIASKSRI